MTVTITQSCPTCGAAFKPTFSIGCDNTMTAGMISDCNPAIHTLAAKVNALEARNETLERVLHVNGQLPEDWFI